MSEKYRVLYTGKDSAEIRNGSVYFAENLIDSVKMIGVIDESGEMYAYPKELFEVVDG